MTIRRSYDRNQPSLSSFDYGSSQQDAREHPGPTRKQTPRPVLSNLIRGFIVLELEDYKAKERYCTRNPAIWSQDANELRKLRELAIIHLQEQKDEPARRCAECLLIIEIVQQRALSTEEANSFLKSLRQNNSAFHAFQSGLDRFIDSLGQEDISRQVDVPSSESYSQPHNMSGNSRQPTGQELTGERTTDILSDAQIQSSPAQVFHRHIQPQSHQTELTFRGRESSPPRQASSKGRALVTAPEVAASQPEEDSEIFPASTTTTIDDNSALDEQERPERIIDEKTAGMGPLLNLFPTKEERDKLHASYKLWIGQEAIKFFLKGRVFAMVWHENPGISKKSNSTAASAPLDKPFHRFTRTADGVTIFSHIRRFVIVKAPLNRRYCWAIPINSYSGRGLTDKNMSDDEKQAHTIIHAVGSLPVRIKSEVKLDKEPIAVKMEPGEELTPSSRLHFGKVQCIDWNIRVKKIGRIVDKKNMRRLTLYFKQEFQKGDDTTTEVESSR